MVNLMHWFNNLDLAYLIVLCFVVVFLVIPVIHLIVTFFKSFSGGGRW